MRMLLVTAAIAISMSGPTHAEGGCDGPVHGNLVFRVINDATWLNQPTDIAATLCEPYDTNMGDAVGGGIVSAVIDDNFSVSLLTDGENGDYIKANLVPGLAPGTVLTLSVEPYKWLRFTTNLADKRRRIYADARPIGRTRATLLKTYTPEQLEGWVMELVVAGIGVYDLDGDQGNGVAAVTGTY